MKCPFTLLPVFLLVLLSCFKPSLAWLLLLFFCHARLYFSCFLKACVCFYFCLLFLFSVSATRDPCWCSHCLRTHSHGLPCTLGPPGRGFHGRRCFMAADAESLLQLLPSWALMSTCEEKNQAGVGGDTGFAPYTLAWFIFYTLFFVTKVMLFCFSRECTKRR